MSALHWIMCPSMAGAVSIATLWATVHVACRQASECEDVVQMPYQIINILLVIKQPKCEASGAELFLNQTFITLYLIKSNEVLLIDNVRY